MKPRLIKTWRPEEAPSRLSTMGSGLSPTTLWEAIEYGQDYASECGPNDPPVGKGIITWTKMHRYLRDRLLPHGWTKKNEKGYAATVSPDGSVEIAVGAGDSNTGVESQIVQLRSPKGVMTDLAIGHAQRSFADVDSEWDALRPHQTWLLLYYFDEFSDEVRGELSLPTSLSNDGYVTGWEERILLSASGAMRSDGGGMDSLDQLDVQVDRKGQMTDDDNNREAESG